MAKESRNQTGCLTRIGQIITVLVMLVGLFLLAGMLYQQSAMEHDRTTYVSSNNLVEVDGVEMHIQCEGEGSPTVVFESGAGTPHTNWWQVQKVIVQDVRTCVYDRQNIGWSEHTGNIPTPEFVAQTLHMLLENAGESAPYLLVGHSLGGVYVREYAMQYPNDVVGMILIDSSHEQQLERFPEVYSVWAISEPPTLTLCRVIAQIGILRILNLGSASTQFPEDTPIYSEEIAIFNQSHFCSGVSSDVAGVTSLDISTGPGSLGGIPLTVLTAGVQQADNPEIFPVGFSVEILQEIDRTWLYLQEELATLSTNSLWIVVEDTTHYIHLDQPQVVIDAIRDILAQVSDAQ